MTDEEIRVQIICELIRAGWGVAHICDALPELFTLATGRSWSPQDEVSQQDDIVDGTGRVVRTVQDRGGLHAGDTSPWRGALTEHPIPGAQDR